MDNSIDSIVEPGQDYLVPHIAGVPVTLPPHVDEGTEGPTGQHYHVDHRFGVGKVPIDEVDENCVWENRLGGPVVKTRILSSEQEPELKPKRSLSIWHPSGETFTSLLYLYMRLGTESSKDGYCVHHRTKLGKRHGCLVCPNHGMEFKADGSPRYQAPFWLSIDGVRVLATLRPDFTGLEGNLRDKVLRLEDSNQEVIAWDTAKSLSIGDVYLRKGDTLHLTIKAWTDNPCLKVKS